MVNNDVHIGRDVIDSSHVIRQRQTTKKLRLCCVSSRCGPCRSWLCWWPCCCVAGWGRADQAVDPDFVEDLARWRRSCSSSTRPTCRNTRWERAVCLRVASHGIATGSNSSSPIVTQTSSSRMRKALEQTGSWVRYVRHVQFVDRGKYSFSGERYYVTFAPRHEPTSVCLSVCPSVCLSVCRLSLFDVPRLLKFLAIFLLPLITQGLGQFVLKFWGKKYQGVLGDRAS